MKAAATKTDDCCLKAAMANWTLCNLYAGCRGIEWSQTDSTKAPLNQHHRNRFGNANVFTLRDIECTTAANQNLTTLEALANPANVGCIRLRFEEQKNSENGEKKLFARPQFKKSASMLRHTLHANPQLPRATYKL
jgi:hypothetical protein